MTTQAELEALIADEVEAALAANDPVLRRRLLIDTARAAYLIAYDDLTAAGSAVAGTVDDFVNAIIGALDMIRPQGTLAQAEQLTTTIAAAATNAAVVATAEVPLAWYTADDEAVREMHRPLHGTTASGGTWDVGGHALHYPGEPVGPPEVWINCRCHLAPALTAGGDMDVLETVESDDELVARSFDTATRKAMAKRHTAMPDGSFPIANAEDLRNAIHAIGRAKDPDAVKRHIRKRARALGLTSLIPESWTASVEESDELAAATGTRDGPGWLTNPRETQKLRTYWTRGAGAAKIRWGVPGDFDRCRRQLAKYVASPFLEGTCANMHKVALGFWPGQPPHGRKASAETPAEYEEMTVTDAFTAAAETPDELPPLEWFEDPGFDGPTPLTVTADGRVLGHLATWGTCHVGRGECTQAPRSRTDYAYFRTGEATTAGGEMVPVGQITMDTGHADTAEGPQAAVAHYDDTGTVVADVAAGEDAHGIWVAGQVRPGVTEAQLRALRAGSLSGDWRRIGGNLELVAALVVNVPGFPIPRVEVASAGDRELSLVAAAVVSTDPNARDADRIAVAVVDALEAKRERIARADRAAASQAEVRKVRVAALHEMVAAATEPAPHTTDSGRTLA